MIYDIKYWPDPFLRKVAKDVPEEEYDNIGMIVANMFETMKARGGMGLAAVQCGLDMRLLVIDTVQVGGKTHQAFINPVIKETTEKKIISEEGCLSFPGVFANVERLDGVVVESETLTGETEEVILNRMDAICFQHELDHLNGIVFFDYLKPAKRQMMEQKVRKNIKKLERRKK
ncbi:MAG: peptide deformylase [Gammaproteobacteria bacterium]|nr:peptide deformylase [Gammaproteobacteria bacterium]